MRTTMKMLRSGAVREKNRCDSNPQTSISLNLDQGNSTKNGYHYPLGLERTRKHNKDPGIKMNIRISLSLYIYSIHTYIYIYIYIHNIHIDIVYATHAHQNLTIDVTNRHWC